MANPDAYIREIESIDEALKRVNKHAKELRAKKNASRERLYKWMEHNHVEEYKGYTTKKLAPKPKIKRKKPKEKKESAVRLFSEIGVDDPEALWEAFLETQKPVVPDAPDE